MEKERPRQKYQERQPMLCGEQRMNPYQSQTTFHTLAKLTGFVQTSKETTTQENINLLKVLVMRSTKPTSRDLVSSGVNVLSDASREAITLANSAMAS